MNKKITKIILTISALLLVASIFASITVSQNRHHIDTCCEKDCVICETIHIAQKILTNILILMFKMMLAYSICYVLAKIYMYNYIAIQRSLVFQNVQLNE